MVFSRYGLSLVPFYSGGNVVDAIRLDVVVGGEADERKQILLLRHWINSRITTGNHSFISPSKG
jgi:hypothetical protein